MTLRVETFTQDKTDARSVSFSEQEAYWTLPLHETSVVTDVAVTKGTLVMVEATQNCFNRRFVISFYNLQLNLSE